MAYTSNVQLQKKQLLLNSKQPIEERTIHWKTFLFSPGNSPTVCFFIYVVVTWYLVFINTKRRSLNLSICRARDWSQVVIVHQAGGGKHCGSPAEEHQNGRSEVFNLRPEGQKTTESQRADTSSSTDIILYWSHLQWFVLRRLVHLFHRLLQQSGRSIHYTNRASLPHRTRSRRRPYAFHGYRLWPTCYQEARSLRQEKKLAFVWHNFCGDRMAIYLQPLFSVF